MIYAIQAGVDGPIKFGVAKNPKQRMSELQTGNPCDLRLLACADVAHDKESLIHYHLRDSHMRGEWFKPCEQVLALVESIRRQAESENHVITDHIYDNDLKAIEWFRANRLGWQHDKCVGGCDNGERLGNPNDVLASGDDRLPKQRWSRDKYNAYQREYMRKRRLTERTVI